MESYLIIEYFSTLDHQIAACATFFAILAAYLFTEKSDTGPWVGVISEMFWIWWIWETKKFEIFPIEFSAFIIYIRACVKQLKMRNYAYKKRTTN